MTLSTTTTHFYLGLIGYPLGHSLSPRIHKAALHACGLKGDYSRFPVHPADDYSLKEMFTRIRSGEVQGLNVTIPHKQNVIPYLDELTPTAAAIGAVNTIYLREGKLIGDNTDAPGFLDDLKRRFDFLPFAPGSSALILGAGGSARAVVYALLRDGWNITIAARRMEQACELAERFENVKVIHYTWQAFQPLDVQLIVNTTPVGMTPDVDQSPWPENLTLPLHAAVYDLVYNPRQTKLVRDARSQGLLSTSGLGMLISQAALSFEIWTGQQPPLDIMLSAVDHPTR